MKTVYKIRIKNGCTFVRIIHSCIFSSLLIEGAHSWPFLMSYTKIPIEKKIDNIDLLPYVYMFENKDIQINLNRSGLKE